MNCEFYVFLMLIIQYADDIDVGQFLINVHDNLIDRLPDYEIGPKINKEYFLKYLINENSKYKKLIIYHLRLILMSYNDNYPYVDEHALKYESSLNCDDESDYIVSKDRTGISYKSNNEEKIVSYEEFTKCTRITNKNFEQIFKLSVNNYKENQFYYHIGKKFVTKIRIGIKSNGKIVFKRTTNKIFNKHINNRMVTCMKDSATGLEYNLHENIIDKSYKDRGYKKCIKLHIHIINALKGIEPCLFCNNKKADSTIKPCKNCKK